MINWRVKKVKNPANKAAPIIKRIFVNKEEVTIDLSVIIPLL